MSFTFGIPFGFAFITNMAMFVSFICKIIKMPKLQKDVKNERNDIIIFAKLSTLTGFCWIFGFFYRWTDIQTFSYLFIILNGSQGVLIFLFFVCTRKVLVMYREKIVSMLTTSRSFRTKSTDSKSPGQKYIASQ